MAYLPLDSLTKVRLVNSDSDSSKKESNFYVLHRQKYWIIFFLFTNTRNFYGLVEDLRIMGAEICYSRTTKTYYYCNDFKIEIQISLKLIQEGIVRDLYGGSYFFKENYFPARFLQGTQLP